MLETLVVILLFYLLKANAGNGSNEIFSILSDTTSNISTLPSTTRDTSTAEFPPLKNQDAIRFGNKRLLRIPLPESNISSLICFPSSEEDYQDVYTLSHITCRTMGFMTFASIRAKMSPFNRARIRPRCLNCSGLQRGVRSCEVLQAATENCRMVTEVTCGSCNGTYKGFKGEIKSPGFPIASLDDVTCEWNIIVPEHHDITLSFNKFDAIDVESTDLPCSLHKPYVHIMYGIQSKVTINRYCQLNEVRNLSIPFNTVKIIVFTGVRGREETRLLKKELGISITFQATVPAEESPESPLKLVGFFLLGVIFIACNIFCHYIHKYKLCNYRSIKGRDKHFFGRPMERTNDLHNYNKTIENEIVNMNKCSKSDSAKVESAEFQRKSKMVYESGTGFNEYSNLLKSPTRLIPGVTNRDGDKEKLIVNLHRKLNLVHSYHGTEDPNRLSVTPTTNYYDYPSFATSSHASSMSSKEAKKEKLKISMSTC